MYHKATPILLGQVPKELCLKGGYFVENLKLQWMSMIDAIVDPIMTVDSNYQISKASYGSYADTHVKEMGKNATKS